jgi:hypothetical protein
MTALLNKPPQRTLLSNVPPTVQDLTDPAATLMVPCNLEMRLEQEPK